MNITKIQAFFFFFFESWSNFFNFIGIQDTTRKTPKTSWNRRLLPSSPRSRVGTTWGEAAGGDLEPQSSPAGSRPVGTEGNGEAGPSPHIRTAEVRLPWKTHPPNPHSCARSPQQPEVGPWTHSWLRSSWSGGRRHDYLGRISCGCGGGGVGGWRGG